jgi:transposase-like protein
MKTRERLAARRIRREEGESIKQIARRLGVAASSVSVWVRDIELTEDQHAALQARSSSYNGQCVSAQKRAAQALARRREEQRQGRLLAQCGNSFT